MGRVSGLIGKLTTKKKVASTILALTALALLSQVDRVESWAKNDPCILEPETRWQGDAGIPVRDLCYVRLAGERKDLSYCRDFTVPGFIPYCIAAVITAHGDPARCKEIPLDRNMGASSYVRWKCIAEIAKKKNDHALCDLIPRDYFDLVKICNQRPRHERCTALSENERDHCIVQAAIRHREFEPCQELSQGKKAECETSVKIAREARVKGYSRYCLDPSRPDWRPERPELNRCLAQVAKQLGKKEACAEIEGPDLADSREQCIKGIFARD